MMTLTLTIENAVTYHDPNLNTVPVPTETSIPEVQSDYVLFQVKDSEGRVLLQLPVSNYFAIVGKVDDFIAFNELRRIFHKPPVEVDYSQAPELPPIDSIRPKPPAPKPKHK